MNRENLDEQENNEIENIPSENKEPSFDMELEPPEKPLQAVGEKKLINKLLKRKILLIGVIAGVIFLLFILLLSLFSEGTESTHFRYKENSTCENVAVTYDPYGDTPSSSTTMTLEEYVKSASLAYLKNIKNPSTKIFDYYYALAVAIRTEVISNGCRITYRDKQLNKNSNVENDALERALNLSRGIIMVDEEENIVSAKVSDFCWKTKEEKYTLYQANQLAVEFSFTNEFLNHSIYETCPCNNPDGISPPDPESEEVGEFDHCFIGWDTDDDDIDDEFEWLHQDDETGYSVLGSLAIYNQTGKDYISLLRYFFGDIELMTTEKEKIEEEVIADNSSCSEFSLTSTTLTKSAFVNKVKNYSVRGEEDWALFQSHAEEIYDIAIANHFNPEMIIVRAILEGFSPGGNSHNYFGITCYNGQPEKCSRYDTFEKGILGFIETVKKYSTYLELTKKYAYLGDYWYNPGSWGDGGCAYATYIYPDGLDSYVTDACSSARRNLCVAGGTKSGCVATRQEDKDAYSLYQGRNMTDKRQEIFGFSTNSCTNKSLNYGSCVIFKQGDSRWGSETLGYGNETLKSAGCAVTSVAIALTCTGEVTDPDFSPKVLNDKLKEMGGFSYGAIEWNNDAIREFVPTFRWMNTYQINFYDSQESKIEKMKVGLENNHIGIVHLNSTANGHFVVLQSINEEEGTITVLDPAYGDIHTYSITNVDGFKYYMY